MFFFDFPWWKVIPESKAYQICPKKINPKMPCDTPWHQPKQYALKKRKFPPNYPYICLVVWSHPQTWIFFFHDPCIPPPPEPPLEFHHLTSQSLVRAPLSWIGVFPKKSGVWMCFLQVFLGIVFHPHQWLIKIPGRFLKGGCWIHQFGGRRSLDVVFRLKENVVRYSEAVNLPQIVELFIFCRNSLLREVCSLDWWIWTAVGGV